MILMKFMRRLFKKADTNQQMEYVKATSAAPPLRTIAPSADLLVHESIPSPVEAGREDEIAFSPQGDLEAYVRGLDVSKEAIEGWISAGVLLPEETKVAIKMIRIMCRNNKHKFE
jgi:hypothetical protein